MSANAVPEVQVLTVAQTLVECPSLLRNWRQLSDCLELSYIQKHALEQMLIRNESMDLLFQELLTNYVDNDGDNATIGDLRETLTSTSTSFTSASQRLNALYPDNNTRLTTVRARRARRASGDKVSVPVPSGNVPVTAQAAQVPVPSPSTVSKDTDGQCFGKPRGNAGEDEIDFEICTQPLKVVVTKSETFLGDPQNNDYSLRSTPRGFALIINNINFDDLANLRKGAEVDGEYVQNLLKQMSYECSYEQDVADEDELRVVIKRFKKKFTVKKVDSCMVVVMSHGSCNQVYMCDDKPVHLWKEIVYQFDNINCPQLQGIPKIFIIQACQDFRSGTDAPGVGTPSISDTVVCFPTIPGTSAQRDLFKGTWYIYCLTKVIMENAHKMHFVQLLEKVQTEEMRKIRNTGNIAQVSTWQQFIFHNLYFNPGL